MHVLSDLGGPGHAPTRPRGHRLVAAIDVEWTKNYKIKNGNRVFCYSIVWLSVPERNSNRKPTRVRTGPPFRWTSAYLNTDAERASLIEMAASDIAAAIDHADQVIGHQLCSDFAVLTANAGRRVPAALLNARRRWHERRNDERMLDTRFDAGHILCNESRRLVDVCNELKLDVTQPELSRKSMTALHRDWIERGDKEARERITVLNLRHSVSSAYVALRASGHLVWSRKLSVNSALTNALHGELEWLEHPTFQALVRSGARR